MMAIIKFNIISCFLCFLIAPYLFVDAQESDNDTPKLIHAWLSRCFVKGFNVPTDCGSLSLDADLSDVHELAEKCLHYYQLGCNLGKLNSFCSTGIKRVLNTVNKTQTNCGGIEIPGDNSNVAFACCLTCVVGIKQAESGEKCQPDPNLNVLPERALHFCCNTLNKSSPVNLSSNASETNVDNGGLVNITNLSNDNLVKLSEGVNTTLTSSLDKSDDVGLEKATVSPNMVDFETSSSVSTIRENITTSDASASSSKPTTADETTTSPTTTTTNPPTETKTTPEPTSTSTTERTTIFGSTAEALVSVASLESSNSTPSSSTRSSGSEESDDHSATQPKCSLGFELDAAKTQCVYIDYCKKDPCFQSHEDQHYCVNYFIGRECIDKIPEKYVWEKKYNLLRLEDTSTDSSYPILLDLAQTEATLESDGYKNFPFVHLKLPISFECSWEKKLDQTWPLIPGQGLKEDQLIMSTETGNEYKILINGAVQPQAAAISIDCIILGRIHYRHTVYFTFNPHQNETILF